jgi:NAD(P)-dependent dehydrogenase (short-subunit alcohol dehydrogenase family)
MNAGRVLEGETAIITGAGRGIGRAIGLAFARAGAAVVAASRTAAEVEETAREVRAEGGRAFAVTADVTRKAEVDSLVDLALKETGRLDIVVNNAGVFVWKALGLLDESEWDRILNTNLKSSYLLIHAALPALSKSGRGRIVNIASIHGTIGDANVVAHCAAKFGLIGLTKALARELREVGITVNAVCPGSTDNKTRETASVKRQFPLKEKLAADDVAQAALYLASPSAAAVSGAILDVWGGTYLSIKG